LEAWQLGWASFFSLAMIITKPSYTSGTDVVSLADMKLFLRVDGSDEDDTITALLDAAVAHISDYTNRHFTADSTTKFYLGRWRNASLAFGPVTRVVSVKYDDTSGAQQTLATSKWYTEKLTDNTTRISFHDTPDLEDYNASPVEIECNCGAAESPQIKVATKLLVAHWFENRRAVITGASANTVPLSVHSLLNSERIIDMRQ
jgi:uncharacterized phiE125 gp8 family phage protein